MYKNLQVCFFLVQYTFNPECYNVPSRSTVNTNKLLPLRPYGHLTILLWANDMRWGIISYQKNDFGILGHFNPLQIGGKNYFHEFRITSVEVYLGLISDDFILYSLVIRFLIINDLIECTAMFERYFFNNGYHFKKKKSNPVVIKPWLNF